MNGWFLHVCLDSVGHDVQVELHLNSVSDWSSHEVNSTLTQHDLVFTQNVGIELRCQAYFLFPSTVDNQKDVHNLLSPIHKCGIRIDRSWGKTIETWQVSQSFIVPREIQHREAFLNDVVVTLFND